MRYYVKSENGEMSGPYSIEELNCLIYEEEIGPDWIAISDIGQTAKELIRSPAWHWMWIADIPGVTGVQAPLTKGPAENRSTRHLLVAAFVLLIFIFVLLAIAFSISSQLNDLH